MASGSLKVITTCLLLPVALALSGCSAMQELITGEIVGFVGDVSGNPHLSSAAYRARNALVIHSMAKFALEEHERRMVEAEYRKYSRRHPRIDTRYVYVRVPKRDSNQGSAYAVVDRNGDKVNNQGVTVKTPKGVAKGDKINVNGQQGTVI